MNKRKNGFMDVSSTHNTTGNKVKFIYCLTLTLLLPFFVFSSAYSETAKGDSPEVKALIQKIKEDIYLDRLTYPPKNNAVLKLQQLESLQPNHPLIRPLYKKVAEAYITLANNAIREEKFKSAQRYIKKAEAQYPEGTFYDKYRKLLKRRMEAQKAGEELAVNEVTVNEDVSETKDEKATDSEAEAQGTQEDQEETQEDQETEEVDLAEQKEEVEDVNQISVVKDQNSRFERPEPISVISLDRSILEKPLAEVDDTLTQACQEIVDQNAFVQIMAENKKAYRSLLVKLTVCTRRISDEFQLRHRHELIDGGKLVLNLYKKRFTNRYTKPAS